MKNVLNIFIIILSMCLYGCKNKLVCTYSQNYDDIKINNKIEFNFKNNTYKEIDKMIFKDKDDAKEYFNDVEEYVNEYNLKLNENIIVSELNGSFNESKSKIRTKYEGYDYTCK